MKPLLMHRARDYSLRPELPCNGPALAQDMELDTLLCAMADGDKFLYDVALEALLSGLENDVETILYRQAALRDCMRNPKVVRALYDLAVEAIEARQQQRLGIFSRSPDGILYGGIRLMRVYMGFLGRLRVLAHDHAGGFSSEAFTRFFAALEDEVTDEFLAAAQNHLRQLRFPAGVLVSAELGKGNESRDYVLREPRVLDWRQRLLRRRPPAFSFSIHPRDDAGARALSELRNRGIHLAANALAQSADHILSVFETLRAELAFYLGCLNLHDRLAAKGEPTCFPRPAGVGERRHRLTGLYDVCLSLHMTDRVVGNSLDMDGKRLVVITGANQGGKSTFLRGIGLAQLMMQCGMFVGAESFEAELCTGLFTHYKREEDATMKSGKLDEELARMSDIADSLTPNSMVLLNESFAATNEREGSEIARQVVSALLERHIKTLFVTHLYEFARGLFDRPMEDTIFLRAERRADGTRTFRLVPDEPLETSYGEDLYRKVFMVRTGAERTEHSS